MDRLDTCTWCMVGNLHSKDGKNEVAIRAFERAVQLDQHHSYARTLLAHEYLAMEEYERALQCYREAIRIDARSSNAWHGCGMVFFNQRKYEEAESHFRHAVTLNPSSSALKTWLGKALIRLQRHSEALAALQQAVDSDPKNGLAWLEKGCALYHTGDYAEAVRVLEEALVSLIEPDAMVHFQLGKAHKRLDNGRMALKHYQMALALRPSTQDGSRIKQRIDNIDGPDSDREGEL
eukprot:evm.model.scf_4142.1 EVM.evm.TU.scf_4142.1   scf_4142:3113-6783(+)